LLRHLRSKTISFSTSLKVFRRPVRDAKDVDLEVCGRGGEGEVCAVEGAVVGGEEDAGGWGVGGKGEEVRLAHFFVKKI